MLAESRSAVQGGGHDAYPATLTGLGDRVYLASPEVDLETHITDVVNLVEFEDLQGVVLIGHSYGGSVVTGVADRLPERVFELVYLDTAPRPDGGSLIEKFPPGLRERTERQVKRVGDVGGSPSRPGCSWPKWRASKGWTRTG